MANEDDAPNQGGSHYRAGSEAWLAAEWRSHDIHSDFIEASDPSAKSIQRAHRKPNIFVWTAVAVITMASIWFIFIGSIDKIGLKQSLADLCPPILAAVGITAIAFFAIDGYLANRALQRIALLDISRTRSQLENFNDINLRIKLKPGGRDPA